jgi:hypothetical protein
MKSINVKIGRKFYEIDESDLVMYNGVCYQLITREVGGTQPYSPRVSDKMFKALKKQGLFMSDEETKLVEKKIL